MTILTAVILLCGMLSAVLFSIIIIKPVRKKNQYRWLLALLVFLFAIYMLESFVRTSGKYFLDISLYRIMLYRFFSALYYLIGPSLLWYLMIQLNPSFFFKRKYLIHGIPFLLFIFIESSKNSLMMARFFHLFLYMLIYWKYALLYRFPLPDSVRNSQSRWPIVRTIGILFSLLVISDIAFFLIRIHGGTFSLKYEKWLVLWKAVATFYLSIRFLAVPEIDRISTSGNGRKQNLSAEEMNRLFDILTSFISDQRPFCDPNLTIRKLSSMISIPYWQISEIVHWRLGVNFQTFINGYRIDEAKRLIQSESEKMTLLEIAYQSGFNSKSTFNAAFKLHSGYTPSAFRKQSHLTS